MKRLDSIEDVKNRKIDFVSIDTVGNELGVVKSIDFNNSKISCFVIENYYKDSQITNLLQENNYKHIARLKCDDVYVHKTHLSFGFIVRLNRWKGTVFFFFKIISKFLKNM